MSIVKERLYGAITVMSEEEATRIWESIKIQFNLQTEDPTNEELEIINAYNMGHDDYIPLISHSDLKKELALE